LFVFRDPNAVRERLGVKMRKGLSGRAVALAVLLGTGACGGSIAADDSRFEECDAETSLPAKCLASSSKCAQVYARSDWVGDPSLCRPLCARSSDCGAGLECRERSRWRDMSWGGVTDDIQNEMVCARSTE
jgi:hypothetical protein